MLTFHISILLVMLLEIFGRGVNLQSILLFLFITVSTYLLGSVKAIQNNYIVHILQISFTPLIITIQAKFPTVPFIYACLD